VTGGGVRGQAERGEAGGEREEHVAAAGVLHGGGDARVGWFRRGERPSCVGG
jgi:hypothetical protein